MANEVEAPQPLMIEVLGFFERRQIEEIRDKATNRVTELVPVSGGYDAAIDVRLPSGKRIRLKVDPWVLDELYEDRKKDPSIAWNNKWTGDL